MSKKNKPTDTTPSLFEASDTGIPEPLAMGQSPSIEFPLPNDLDSRWLELLAPETTKPYWNELQQYVAHERENQTVFPPAHQVFEAFRETPFDRVRVLLLGQDPYPGAGQAHGLSFSVLPGVRLPGSLRNIYKELQTDLGIPPVRHGYLASWAKLGILMLNACLTVREGAPNSHAGRGWETFTDRVIATVNDQARPIIFLLWGAYAQKKCKLIDEDRHRVVKSAHPSPLSASNGFFGSKPFSKINTVLKEWGQEAIDWRLHENVDG